MSTAVTPAGKPWYKSKTVWLNIFTLLLGLATVISKIVPAPVAWGITMLAMPVLNLILRIWFTNVPIGS